jgi:hypothetical protein
MASTSLRQRRLSKRRFRDPPVTASGLVATEQTRPQPMSDGTWSDAKRCRGSAHVEMPFGGPGAGASR